MEKREKFATRLGFILISAGCAIGLGNVWRFPYITGEYGGAAFVVMYLVFLAIFGLPIMAMEFAAGRASKRSIARSYDELEPEGGKWHMFKWVAIGGTYLLMMFYTVVAGWMLAYIPKMATGQLSGLDAVGVEGAFNSMLANPGELIFWMLIACAIGFAVVALGLKNGVERITKVIMVGLLVLIGVLVIRSVTLDGAGAGLEFYLAPDFGKLFASPEVFAEAAYAAMGQAFFTLSIGQGSMIIFGSYIGRDRSLLGEAVTIGALDTFIAIAAGLVVFHACFAFGVNPGSGPGLVFITLPSVFEQMWMGQLWGTLFFLFMACAAISTVIAVFEGIVSFGMDQWGWSRKKAVLINIIAIPILSLPAALGFNLWSGAEIAGIGNIQSIEDFLVSSNILPIGSLVLVLFCTSRRGWGWKNFLAEVNAGTGLKFPGGKPMFYWMKFGVPVLVLIILVMGWMPIISTWLA